jgi:hypothetical protein
MNGLLRTELVIYESCISPIILKPFTVASKLPRLTRTVPHFPGQRGAKRGVASLQSVRPAQSEPGSKKQGHASFRDTKKSRVACGACSTAAERNGGPPRRRQRTSQNRAGTDCSRFEPGRQSLVRRSTARGIPFDEFVVLRRTASRLRLSPGHPRLPVEFQP